MNLFAKFNTVYEETATGVKNADRLEQLTRLMAASQDGLSIGKMISDNSKRNYSLVGDIEEHPQVMTTSAAEVNQELKRDRHEVVDRTPGDHRRH